MRKVEIDVEVIEARSGRVVRTDRMWVYSSDHHPDSDETLARRNAHEGRRGKYRQRLAGWRRVPMTTLPVEPA